MRRSITRRCAVAMLEREGNRSSARYTSALHNLAFIYNDAGRFTDAAAVQRQVVEVTRRIGHGRTTSMAVFLNNYAVSQRRFGWWLAAERSFRETIELSRGIEPSGRVPAARMQNYGRVLVALGRRSEGKEWLLQALEQTDAAPRFLNAARLALASVLVDEGNLTAARETFARAERDLRTPTPPERVAMTMVRAQIAAAEGRLADARARLAETIAAEGYPGVLSPFVHELLEYDARLAVQDGKHEPAARLARDAIAACERHFGTQEPSAHTGRARLTLGLALLAGGHAVEGRAELETAIQLIAAAAGPEHPWVQEARMHLAVREN